MPRLVGFGTFAALLEEQLSEKISRRILAGDQGMIVWWSIGAGVHVERHSLATEQIVWMPKGKMEFRLGERTAEPELFTSAPTAIGGAPATISEAEAEPPLISTMTGLFLMRSPARALKRWVSSAVRTRVDTISGTNRRPRPPDRAIRPDCCAGR
jgi:hypothetical protein